MSNGNDAHSNGPAARLEPLPSELVDRARSYLEEHRQGPWFRQGAWSISHHNFAPYAAPSSEVPREVRLVDLTGRVIEQVPGIALTPVEKVALATELAEAGVKEMHAGLFIVSPTMQAHIRAIKDAQVPIKIVQMVYTVEQVRLAAEAGADIAEVVGQGRAALQGGYLGRTFNEGEMLELARERIKLAKSLGMEVRAVINGIGETDIDYVPQFASMAAEEGADSMFVADGPAGMGPRASAHVVKTIKGAAPDLPVGMHFHNDFGLALPNALASLEAGASAFDASVHGTGERAGQLDMAQIALVLEAFYQVETGIQFGRLNQLSRVVEDFTRLPVSAIYPIVGPYSFGSAVDFIQKQDMYVDEALHMPIDPDFVGGRRSFPLGRHTGSFGLLLRAERIGVEVPEASLEEAVSALDHWFEVHKREIADDEFRLLLADVTESSLAPA